MTCQTLWGQFQKYSGRVGQVAGSFSVARVGVDFAINGLRGAELMSKDYLPLISNIDFTDPKALVAISIYQTALTVFGVATYLMGRDIQKSGESRLERLANGR